MDNRCHAGGRRAAASRHATVKAAYVTFLMRNDSYLPGALLLGHELRRMTTRADVVCLITSHVSAGAAHVLRSVFDHVVTVADVYVPHRHTCGRPGVPHMFTRINALRLGSDGDLGFEYEKLVVLDADVLPLARYDDLLDLDVPAGVLNERKEHFVPVGRRSGVEPSTSLGRDGLIRWCWHNVYEATCPHGYPIPVEVTDRVLTDPTNMGINGALLVLEPSMPEYGAITDDLASEETRTALSQSYMWPDMQYLTGRWSGRWRNVDVRYASLNGYPHPRHLYGVHLAGIKPWNVNHRSFHHYSRFEDFELWRRRFVSMMDREPGLSRYRKLRRLRWAMSHSAAPRPEDPRSSRRNGRHRDCA